MTELISRQAALDAIDKNRDALLSSGMVGAEHILVHYGRRVIEELPTDNPLVPILERLNSKYKEYYAKTESSNGLAVNYYAGKAAGVQDAMRIVLKVWREADDGWEEPEINPCRGCDDYDGRGGCKSHGGCGAERE